MPTPLNGNEMLSIDTRTHRIKRPRTSPGSAGVDIDFSGINIVGLPIGGVDVSKFARTDQPNVFNRETTLSGFRVINRIITSDYTAVAQDAVILVDCTTGNVNVTLPPCTGSGQVFRLRKLDQTSNVINILPHSGDLINLGTSAQIVNYRLGILISDVMPGLWDIWVSPAFAHTAVENTFTQVTNVNGLRLAQPGYVTTPTYQLQTTDTAVLADATAQDVNIYLPLAQSALDSTIGSGQLYHIKRVDTSLHVVNVVCQGSDLIDGAVSVTLSEPGSDILLYGADTNYWSQVGALPGFVAKVQSTVPWWFRPDITNDTQLAAWPTLANPVNTRVDVLYADGMRTYLIKPLAADVSDPGQVAPNDYNATTNNVHWQKML